MKDLITLSRWIFRPKQIWGKNKHIPPFKHSSIILWSKLYGLSKIKFFEAVNSMQNTTIFVNVPNANDFLYNRCIDEQKDDLFVKFCEDFFPPVKIKVVCNKKLKNWIETLLK